MTSEEAKERIDCIIMKHEVNDENVTIINEKDYDALSVAYKILEQDFYMIMNEDDIKILLDIDHSMECALESDPRTMTDPTCEYGWLFNAIHEWRKKLKRISFSHKKNDPEDTFGNADKSVKWVGENIDFVKLQDNSEPIEDFISRRKKSKKLDFGVHKENYMVTEE